MGNSGCSLCFRGAPKVLGRWCWSPLLPGPGSGGWHLLLKAGRRGLPAVVEECLFCCILLIKADFDQGRRVNTLLPLQHMLWEASSPQKLRLSAMPFLWKGPLQHKPPLLDGEILFTKPKSGREKEGVTTIHHKSSGSAHLSWKHSPVPGRQWRGEGLGETVSCWGDPLCATSPVPSLSSWFYLLTPGWELLVATTGCFWHGQISTFYNGTAFHFWLLLCSSESPFSPVLSLSLLIFQLCD